MATVFSLMGQSTSRSNQAGQGNHSGAPVPEGPQAFGEILAAGQMNLSSLSPEGRLPPGIVVAADLTAGKVAESAVFGQVGEAEVAEVIASVSGNSLPQGDQGLPHMVSLQLPATGNRIMDSELVQGEGIESDSVVASEALQGQSPAVLDTLSASGRQAIVPAPMSVAEGGIGVATTAKNVREATPTLTDEFDRSAISGGISPSGTATPSLNGSSQGTDGLGVQIVTGGDSETAAPEVSLPKVDPVTIANGAGGTAGSDFASPERSDPANLAVASVQQRPALSSAHKRSDSDRGNTSFDSSGSRNGAVVADQLRTPSQARTGIEQGAARFVAQSAAQQIEPAVFNASSSATTTATTVDSAQKSTSFAKDMERLSAAGASDNADSGIKNALASLSQTSSSSAKPLPQFTISQPVSLSPGWEQAMAGRVVWMGAQGVQSANLTLNPQDLGAIQIQVDISGDQASVQFQAQSTETCDLIEKLMPRLSHALEGQGLKLEESKVSQFTPSQDSSNAQQAANQNANQSAGRQGGEGANQRGRADSANPSLMGQEPADELVQSTISPLSNGVDYYA